MKAFIGRGIFLFVDATSPVPGVLAESDCAPPVRPTVVSTEFAGGSEDMGAAAGKNQVPSAPLVYRVKRMPVIDL